MSAAEYIEAKKSTSLELYPPYIAAKAAKNMAATGATDTAQQHWDMAVDCIGARVNSGTADREYHVKTLDMITEAAQSLQINPSRVDRLMGRLFIRADAS